MKLVLPSDLPPILHERFAQVSAHAARIDVDLPEPFVGSAAKVLTISDFVLGVLMKHPAELCARLADATPLTAASVGARLNLKARSEPDAMAAIRRLRHVEMARIAWRDLAGVTSLVESLHDLSALADGLIESALIRAGQELAPHRALPVDADGQPAPLLVLAMGKLGGRELNFSSDVDLVFLYSDEACIGEGETEEISSHYRRVAQRLIRLLDQPTEDGFALRVDVRLRPFGQSGPLVVSLAAFESYLLKHGRDWERYAYLKARLITGESYGTAVFDEILTPYVYRKYIDFGVFDALRDMKRLIEREVARKDMADNIKLGPGGIREVEFIVQAFQLVRGGRDPNLRTPSLLQALPQLEHQRALGTRTVERLREAYVYLRLLENRLQALDDRQTHTLPTEECSRARLAYAMGHADWPQLAVAVAAHRSVVEADFDRIAWEPQERSGSDEDVGLRAAWESDNIDELLESSPLANDQRVAEMLTDLRRGSLYGRMDETGRQRLAAIVIRTLPLIARQADPATVLARVLTVYQAVCRRSAYLSLLQQNPAALERLISLASQGAILAQQIAEHPLLLDELLDSRVFEAPPSRAELQDMLQSQLRQAAGGDIEALLEAMRQFQRAAVFRVAIADRLGRLPLMRVSDRLTDIAELVLELALKTAWEELTVKHGKPMHGEPLSLEETGFAVIGYGKLGGLELAYDSDLDLVFLHDSVGSFQETDGDRPLDDARFFSRLVQRLIHFLSIQTSSGRLYDVDTRLRPGGGAGLVVSSLVNFQHYQREQAWVWEHQALLRSRSVAGSVTVRTRFEDIRREVLVNHVARDRLKVEVAKMRNRMRSELSQGGAAGFDLKQDPGGLADVEFLADYWILAHAHEHPELVEYSDNMRQLDGLERVGVISHEQCARLQESYLSLRQLGHERALAGEVRVVPVHELGDVREYVSAEWTRVFGGVEPAG